MAEERAEERGKEVMLTVHVRVPRIEETLTPKIVEGIRKAVSTVKGVQIRYNVSDALEVMMPIRRTRRR